MTNKPIDNKKNMQTVLSKRMEILQSSRQQHLDRLNRAQQELEAAKNGVIELNGRIGELQLTFKELGIRFVPSPPVQKGKTSLKSVAKKNLDQQKADRLNEMNKDNPIKPTA